MSKAKNAELGSRVFADQLSSDGIEEIVGQHDLDLGDRLLQLMEELVTLADHVLVACTPIYKVKADARIVSVNYGVGISSTTSCLPDAMNVSSYLLSKMELSHRVSAFLAGKFGID